MYKRLVDYLFDTTNETTLRNISVAVNNTKVTDYRESEFIDLLIGFIQNSEHKVALQVYSIYTLMQFAENYPELIEELKAIIEHHSEGKTVAYKVAQRKFFKKFT